MMHPYDHHRPAPPFRFAHEIETRPAGWLWPGWIPRGSLTLLVGDPGIGKSLLAADIAARVTSVDKLWPDQETGSGEQGAEHCSRAVAHGTKGPQSSPSSLRRSVAASLPTEAALAARAAWALRQTFTDVPYGVVFAATDDGAEDALVPRLTAAGADLECVSILDIDAARRDHSLDAVSRNPYDPTPFSALAEALRAHSRPALLVLDTLPALGLAADGGLPVLLNALAELARTRDVAILATTHLTKYRVGRRFVQRVRGSLAYVAAARYVLALTVDDADPDARILATVKSAYDRPAPPLRFGIAPGPRLRWDRRPLDIVPTDLLDLPPDAGSALSEAVDWLRETLLDGPVSAHELIKQANAIGISTRTLNRAKRLLRIPCRRCTVTQHWSWFPPQDTPAFGAGET